MKFPGQGEVHSGFTNAKIDKDTTYFDRWFIFFNLNEQETLQENHKFLF